MNLHKHKEDIRPTHFNETREEDDYIVFDPNSHKEIVSPLKFVDDDPKEEYLEQNLYVLQ